MAQGIARGESTTAIAKRFEKIGVSEGAAAKRLARTMIGGAQNGGKQAAMQRASASGIIMGKQWKAFHDARTRDSHIMLDNEIVAVDDAFSNGCRYPRDPEGAPGEICNCRCTMSGKVMGFRHSDGSVTMVDMSVNCTEMPEGIFPPGYTYSQWKQDAQNRITAKQLREEELAAAENPGYGNSLLQKGRKHGIIASNKQHFKRDIEKEQAIERAIKSDKPAFAEDLYKNYKSEKIPSGYYGVALHGTQYNAKVYGKTIDARAISNIIKARDDYNGEPVYLICCHSGQVDKKGNCLAQAVANIMGVKVEAPNTYAAIAPNGEVFLSDENGYRITGEFSKFKPRRE